MKNVFSPSNNKLQSIVFATAMILGLSGMAHAQTQNLKGESTQKSVKTEKKSAKGNSTKNKTKVREENSSRQEAGEGSANYKGAQPPQGGRLGQGPE
jgi:uncharacterized protein HemX